MHLTYHLFPPGFFKFPLYHRKAKVSEVNADQYLSLVTQISCWLHQDLNRINLKYSIFSHKLLITIVE